MSLKIWFETIRTLMTACWWSHLCIFILWSSLWWISMQPPIPVTSLIHLNI